MRALRQLLPEAELLVGGRSAAHFKKSITVRLRPRRYRRDTEGPVGAPVPELQARTSCPIARRDPSVVRIELISANGQR